MTVKKPTTKKTPTKKTTTSKKAPKPATTEKAPIIVKGYKGFDKDLKCRDKQYALKATFEEPEADLCRTGIHFCEHPLDCFRYYEPGMQSRYAEVEAEDPTEQKDGDSKRVTKKIAIGVELSLKSLIDAAIKFTFDRVTYSGDSQATGNQGAASATGDYGAASATGDYGAASATGDYGAASATGNRGAASATGNRGAASATGYQGAASATGDYGAASATGDYGAASATGNQGIAVATGYMSKVKASLGSWIVLVERDDNWNILDVQSALIDGEKLKPDTWYTLKEKRIVERES